ncbi:hypothetical protein, partial [Spirulina sp. 06S082]|uniref:hypothetical protein n=1 Tax=Spirulina sp. 06S082 TaxID=3110248 RepID=UPI002B21DD47
IKSADCELLLKLIQHADDNKNLAQRIFVGLPYQEQQDENETQIVKSVAQSIFEKYNSFSFRVVCLATSYLADTQITQSTPLYLEEAELGLTINKPKCL